MSNDGKVKILVLGPVSSGKTAICNYLGDAGTENASAGARPTKGLRIVEFTSADHSSNSRAPRKVEVELWDCSGDSEYKRCWPALRHNTDGIMFVCRRDLPRWKETVAEMFDFFVESCDFPTKNCIALSNGSGGGNKNGAFEGSSLEGLAHAVVDLENNEQELRKTFGAFLKGLLLQ